MLPTDLSWIGQSQLSSFCSCNALPAGVTEACSFVSPCRWESATAAEPALSLHGQDHDPLGAGGGLGCVGRTGEIGLSAVTVLLCCF